MAKKNLGKQITKGAVAGASIAALGGLCAYNVQHTDWDAYHQARLQDQQKDLAEIAAIKKDTICVVPGSVTYEEIYSYLLRYVKPVDVDGVTKAVLKTINQANGQALNRIDFSREVSSNYYDYYLDSFIVKDVFEILRTHDVQKVQMNNNVTIETVNTPTAEVQTVRNTKTNEDVIFTMER